MAKRVLKTLDLTTLLVALDHLEEHGPAGTVPDPYGRPAECVYLAYTGDAHLAALTARLPHVSVLFRTPANGPRSKVVRPVFDKSAVLYALRFSFPNEQDFIPFVRELATVDAKHWKVLDANGSPIPRTNALKNGTPLPENRA